MDNYPRGKLNADEIDPQRFQAGLDLSDLRRANRARQEEWPGNELADVAFRALEVAGEAGEVAEAVKKLLRAQRGIRGSTATRDDVAQELGDLLVSLDLLADQLGIDLAEATARKFNATSTKYGLATRLPVPAVPHLGGAENPET